MLDVHQGATTRLMPHREQSGVIVRSVGLPCAQRTQAATLASRSSQRWAWTPGAGSGRTMKGVVVCHGSAMVRAQLLRAAQGVPALAPARWASSGEELLILARRYPPKIVLLDAHLPGTGPIEAIRRLRLMNVGSVIVIVTRAGDASMLARAVNLGARGSLASDATRDELAAVVANVLAAHWSASSSTPRVRARGLAAAVPRQARRNLNADGVTVADLTGRELDVLEGMAQGRSNARIGSDLFLAKSTVKTHASTLYRKLGVSNRTQAVVIGLRQGLIR